MFLLAMVLFPPTLGFIAVKEGMEDRVRWSMGGDLPFIMRDGEHGRPYAAATSKTPKRYLTAEIEEMERSRKEFKAPEVVGATGQQRPL